ncbi:MAG: hypothetical protein RM049_24280 [Nostoc sp. DedQUE04]|uniref:PspA/IM30 family protein n=1 Tax=Nostoc sp. DedQUE04 TaxID=3075390 RepID=UPI002AD2BDB2|nr:hypothetical protein [Nostoc sp. DedQUE04]MDZ8138386.1 hypothetical protein [Nostoc sp. DedQUE04]
MMKNNAPFLTPNPQEFKLRIVWSADSSTKMVAEFLSCKWLPRIGETLVLPIDETRKPSWCKFKVFDVIYDFQHQTVRVLCSPIKSLVSPDVKSLISKVQQSKDNWQVWEKAFEASEATTKTEEPERHFGLGHELYPIDEEDIDEEPKKLELLSQGAMSKFTELEDKIDAMETRQKANELQRQAQLEYELSQTNEEYVDDELEKLKAEMEDIFGD